MRKKRRDKDGMTIAALDLGDSESLATILSPTGDVVDRFPMSMDDDGYALFASRVPRGARIAFEATNMAYPVTRRLNALGYHDITAAHPKELAWIDWRLETCWAIRKRVSSSIIPKRSLKFPTRAERRKPNPFAVRLYRTTHKHQGGI